jgi:gliding motility-associated protein gldL
MSKLNIVIRLQHWMDSVPGQTFLNYAYSWGAAIVILGALFKLTHLPGGNIMLFLGMGTEAVVFFLAAFDRPFDKKEIGKELPKDFETDEEIERAEGLWEPQVTQAQVEATQVATTQVAQAQTATDPQVEGSTIEVDTLAVAQGEAQPANNMAQAAIVTAQQAAAAAQSALQAMQTSTEGAQTTAAPTQTAAVSPEVAATLSPVVAAHYDAPEGQETVAQSAQQLSDIIRLANDELLRRTQAVLSPDMEAATEDYIAKLRTLNETLAKVDEQSARLTRDSQEMENLNRTLIGINKVYDLHFASISRQVTTIEEINNQTQQLAAKIEEVNRIYSRMMQTLNVMGNPMATTNEG